MTPQCPLFLRKRGEPVGRTADIVVGGCVDLAMKGEKEVVRVF
jgi:hypothetical protein